MNFTALMGSGVLHTKLWVVDQKHVYIGSANMDWRSLTEVKVVFGLFSVRNKTTWENLGAGCVGQVSLLTGTKQPV